MTFRIEFDGPMGDDVIPLLAHMEPQIVITTHESILDGPTTYAVSTTYFYLSEAVAKVLMSCKVAFRFKVVNQ